MFRSAGIRQVTGLAWSLGVLRQWNKMARRLVIVVRWCCRFHKV